jgi:hypothetical protein
MMKHQIFIFFDQINLTDSIRCPPEFIPTCFGIQHGSHVLFEKHSFFFKGIHTWKLGDGKQSGQILP